MRWSCYWSILFSLAVFIATLPAAAADRPAESDSVTYDFNLEINGLREVTHERVELRGGFWGPRLKTHHEVTIPHALNCLEKDGHVTNFDKAAGVFDGPLRGHHAFDSDIHKALEGALYCLQHREDPQLFKRVEDILDRILAAQQEDGFLISYYIVRATGERRYLELSRFFLDERGHTHGYERKRFDPNTIPSELPTFDDLPAAERGRARRRARNSIRNGRMQDHKPLVEQNAIGHAVRAGYIYSAMADIAHFMDAPEYENAAERIWHDVVSRKMYITGSIGTAQYHDEGFGDPYLLPNRTYCESCAGIAHVLWQHRMALLKGQAKYADVMELALYNGAISGISISGDKFFYQNPLASKGARRSSWIGLACCPTNLARIIPQVGGLTYARDGRKVYVNLYLAGEASFKIDNSVMVKIAQDTDYPWSGRVRLTAVPYYAWQNRDRGAMTVWVNE